MDHTISNEQGTSSSRDLKMIQSSSKKRPAQAMNSRVTKKKNNMISWESKSRDWLDAVPECPVYRPTREEFQDPLAYIRSIQGQAEQWGICKIIPPLTPTVPGSLMCRELDGAVLKFTTREQPVRERVWNDMDEGKFHQAETMYTFQQYTKLAEEFQRKQLGTAGSFPARMVELEYWRQRKIATDLTVEYGNDVEGTAFCAQHDGDRLGDSDWNLQKLPRLDESTLRLLKGEVPGITTPMLYIGMLYATFAWHVEDHYLYSINYQHLGANKTWYGVPGYAADGFEKVAEGQVYARALQAERKTGREASVAAHRTILGKTTMFSPQLLVDAGVRVCRAVQQPGEFIVTFPRAYHAGFSNGFCVGEAVNFAMHDWYRFGADCCLRYRRLNQPPILPHDELICEEATELRERLISGQGASSSADPAADVSLAGTFVSLLRQQNKQRAVMVRQRKLTQRPMPDDDDDGQLSTDCARCAHLCYLTMVVSQEHEEVRCLECALFDNVEGPQQKLFCHPKLDYYEECARWFEQQPLLKDADWEGRLRNRGLTEDELHSAGWGCPSSRTVPQPNQPFKWAELPSAEPAPEPEESPSAVNAIVEGLASEQTTLMALARDNDSVPRTSMMFSAAKAHEMPLGGSADPVERPQPPLRPALSNAAASDSNMSVDVVGVSTACDAAGERSNSADASSGNKEPTPTSTLDSGAALCARSPLKDSPGDNVQPSAAPVQQEEQPSAAKAVPSMGADGGDGGETAEQEDVVAAQPAKNANATSQRDQASPKKVAPKGPLRFYSGEGGSVQLVSDLNIEMGSAMMRRRVYCLKKDRSQLFLRVREVIKASGQLRTPSEGARDSVHNAWRRAAKKAEDAAAAGLTVPELPPLPRRYTCKDEPDIVNTFLVGLNEVAHIFHWLATSQQRKRLELFCQGVWLSQLEAGCAAMPGVSDSPVIQGTPEMRPASKRGAKLQGRVRKPSTKTRAGKARLEEVLVMDDEVVTLSDADRAVLAQQSQNPILTRFLAKRQSAVS